MAMTETRISTRQRSFGIAGLSRHELHEVQSLIEVLRKYNANSEAKSERGWVEPTHDQSQSDDIEGETSADNGRVLRPGDVLACRAKAKQPLGRSNTRPTDTYSRKERAIAASLTRQAERGEFLAVRNLFVLAPKTSMNVGAEPDTPDRH